MTDGRKKRLKLVYRIKCDERFSRLGMDTSDESMNMILADIFAEATIEMLEELGL